MIPLLLLACTGTPDRDLYLRAASEAGLDEATALCAALGDEDLAGECATFAAARAAESGQVDAALGACAPLTHPWASECAFLVADAGALLGAAALDACGRAGSLEFECLAHAADRDARARPDLPDQVGQERALVKAIEAVCREYLPGERPAVINTVSRGIATRVMARRWSDRRFSTGLCGAAERALCTRAYRASLQPWMLENDVGPLCLGGAPERDRAEAAGLPGWDEASAAIPEEVWARVCDGASPGPVP